MSQAGAARDEMTFGAAETNNRRPHGDEPYGTHLSAASRVDRDQVAGILYQAQDNRAIHRGKQPVLS